MSKTPQKVQSWSASATTVSRKRWHQLLTSTPEIVVNSDYDRYFERLVDGWIQRKRAAGEPFAHDKIVVTAGPYRPDAVSYRSKDGRLHLDFYSALRTGFGSLSEADIEEILKLL